MRWSELSSHPCPVARTLSAIGDRWTILILRDALGGVARFEDFHNRLGCSRAIIAGRLGELVDQGLMRRDLYQEHPPRHEYRLTEKGRSIGPVLLTMAQWGETWMPVENGYSVRRMHRTCGCEFQPVLACSECGQPLRPGEVAPTSDPARPVEAA